MRVRLPPAAEATALAAEIIGAGGQATAVEADVADAGALIRMATRAAADLGPISILVNNAGVALRATLESYVMNPAPVACDMWFVHMAVPGAQGVPPTGPRH